MVPIEDWKQHYEKLVDEIFKGLEPDRVTLGTLRGLSTTIRNAKDTSWIEYLDEKSNWGLKPRFDIRLEMFQFVIDLLEERGFKDYGLCKETVSMWNALGLDYKKINCNCLI